jgi:hypothetical protein
VLRKKASAPIASVQTTDVIPELFLLFLDTDHPCQSRRPSFGLWDGPKVGDINDVGLSNVKLMDMIRLLSGE